MDDGFNSQVERNGQTYDVQSEYSDRNGPLVESRVFRGGEVLVRWTTSYEDIAARYGLTGDDVSHVVEQQHFDLVRKVVHGMLDEDDGAPPPSAVERAPIVRPGAADGITGDPDEISDPAVRAVLADLDTRLDGSASGAARSDTPGRPVPAVRRRRPPWWRIAICFRWRR